MPEAQIQQLIDKVDSFELVRDQIGAILLLESAKQQAYARAERKDPALWELEVFTEASNPISKWDDAPDAQSPLESTSPIVNVRFENTGFDKGSSDVVERQQGTGVFNIDCYGYGQSRSKGSGHAAGDRAAALEAQRALRLVRNILMSSHYVFLGLGALDVEGGFVRGRWPQAIQSFDPQIDGRHVQHVVGVRLALAVDFDEFSPQYQGQPIEMISIAFKRSGTGQLLLQADYQY